MCVLLLVQCTYLNRVRNRKKRPNMYIYRKEYIYMYIVNDYIC